MTFPVPPEGWRSYTVAELCESTEIWNPERQPRTAFTYVDVSAVSRESYSIERADTLSSVNAPSRARKIVQAGDTLFATVRPRLRRIAYVEGPFDQQIASTAFCVLRPRVDVVDPRFLYYAVLTDAFVEAVARHEGGASYPAVRDRDVLAESLLVPALDEQRRIVTVLMTAQRALRIEDRVLAATRELKQVAMEELFTRGLRGEEQNESEIGPVPANWDVVELGTCCDVVSSSISYTEFSEIPEPIAADAVDAMGVKVSDMNRAGNESSFTHSALQKRIDRGVAERKLVPPDTVVFPKRGAAIATNKKRLTTSWTVLDPNLIGVRVRERLATHYLFYWFQHFDLRTITEPGPTPQLNKKHLVPLLIPVPPDMEEQTEIAGILGAVDQKLAVHDRKRAALEHLFQRLLHDLMTGTLRVGAEVVAA